MIGLMALAAAAVGVPPEPPRAAGSFAEFSSSATVIWRRHVVDLGIGRDAQGRQVYWARLYRGLWWPHPERIAPPPPQAEDGIWWADSSRCPAIGEVVAGMTRIATPPITTPPIDPQTSPKDGILIDGISTDGTSYTLRAPIMIRPHVTSAITIESSDGSPLAVWVEFSLKMLEPCWSRERPAGHRPSNARHARAP